MKNKPLLGLVLFIAVIFIYGIVFAQALNFQSTSPVPHEIPDQPIATSTPDIIPSSITLELYKKKIIKTVSITPSAVLEDSRCPSDVLCVWAGRVLVSLNLFSSKGSSSKSVTQGDSFTLDGMTFTLKDVTPYPKSTKKITDAEYRFIFDVVGKSLPRPPVTTTGCYVGGCSGEVCSDKEGLVSACIYRESYACYKTAKCERQASGKCGWTETTVLKKCIDDADERPLQPASN